MDFINFWVCFRNVVSGVYVLAICLTISVDAMELGENIWLYIDTSSSFVGSINSKSVNNESSKVRFLSW